MLNHLRRLQLVGVSLARYSTQVPPPSEGGPPPKKSAGYVEQVTQKKTHKKQRFGQSKVDKATAQATPD